MPKVTLGRTIVYGGHFYGPGEVDVDDPEVAKALSERERAIVDAQAATVATLPSADPDGRPLELPVDDQGQPTSAPEQDAAPRRRARREEG